MRIIDKIKDPLGTHEKPASPTKLVGDNLRINQETNEIDYINSVPAFVLDVECSFEVAVYDKRARVNIRDLLRAMEAQATSYIRSHCDSNGRVTITQCDLRKRSNESY
jgi:hypothetical protein